MSKFKNLSEYPTRNQSKNARDDFRWMLKTKHSEPIWQKFFAANPFILSEGLPLKLMPTHIIPLGRPGKSEPDFLIHPGDDPSASSHGVLEIKTPQTKIFTLQRKGLIGLTRDAATAYTQVKKYDQDYDLFAPKPRAFTFGTRSHLFIIMGQSSELLGYEAALRPDIENLLGREARLLAFDELFESFSRSVPPDVFVLHPLDPPLFVDKTAIPLQQLDTALHRAIILPRAFLSPEPNDLQSLFDSDFSRSRPLVPEWRRGITAVESSDALRSMMKNLMKFPKYGGDRSRLHLSFRLQGKIWDSQGSDVPDGNKRAFYAGADAIRQVGGENTYFEVLNPRSVSDITLLGELDLR
ncbi:Shedu anti-phage system protein SduA domain-containing protein [Rhizobium mongolense]|uniref:Shedu anti-phage system protein SduA domain-containing protein n=1 Tax=Rhizobium mongolense TaxID=57676 RepID=UPI0034A372B5